MVINRLGAPSREGEELGVVATLKLLLETRPSLQIAQLPDGTLDGGDILFTGDYALVGNSHRTNETGIQQLRYLLEPLGIPVHLIPVKAGLHLKSCCSLIDIGTILISDNEAGRQIRKEIENAPVPFDFLVVPDAPASNVLRINNHIVIQDGFPESEKILFAFAESRNLTVHKLKMSEFIKVDGALTCCNILADF